MCQKVDMTETAFYRWRRRFLSLDACEVRGFEGAARRESKLKRLVADSTVDKQVPREALGKIGEVDASARGSATDCGASPA